MSTAQSHKLPTERRFGLTFAAIFAALGVYGLFRGWNWPAYSAWLAASFLLCLIALFSPWLLSPLNRAWFRLGQLLGRIVNPIILGILFFALVTPISLIARLLGRDELRLKRKAVSSYWITRSPPGPTADSFRNQF